MKSVLIHGQGVAALTAAWGLAERGCAVTLVGGGPPSSLQLALDPITVELLDEVFDARLKQLSFSHPISQRIIRGWYSTPMTIETTSLSLPLDALIEHLRRCLTKRFPDSINWCEQLPEIVPHHLVIHATGRRNFDELTFGSRVAAMATVDLWNGSHECVVEKTDYGWAFLIPSRADQAFLYTFAANTDRTPKDLLDSTTKNGSFGNRITVQQASNCWRKIAPSLSYPLATHSNILVGESAFSFDPICGDGVGYAVRSALLAAKIVAENAHREPPVLKYYVARLFRAFHAHLVGCANVYAGWNDAGWSEELKYTQQGISYLQNQVP